jgi:sugar phosphate isomerase/epimerase
VPYAVHTDLKDQRGRSPNHEFLVPGEGDFDYARYLRAMHRLGYAGYVTIEISVMVQRRPDYDPADVAARSYRTLTQAADAAAVPLECRVITASQ